jgi:sarcosine oxidase, subunit delta
MLLVPCPWCGPRPETEFSYGGEAHIVRPKDPHVLSEEEWGDYLYMRSNIRGRHFEQWCHSAGCRRWFNIVRDTVTNHIVEVHQVREPATRGDSDAG